MRKGLFKHIIALFLVITIVLAPATTAFAVQSPVGGRATVEELVQQPETLITRSEFAMLLNAALMLPTDFEGENFLDVPDGHPHAADILTAKTIGYMVGDSSGYVFPNAVISGAEASVIVNNILGFDGSRVSPADSSVPYWALPSVSVLLDLTMADGALTENPQLTVGDALEFINALAVALMFQGSPYALAQADLRDNFYAYVNRQFLATATIPPGHMMASSFGQTSVLVEQQLKSILTGILSSADLTPGSEEWKIRELYKMYLDNESRTASLSVLQPYFDKIRAVETIDELTALAKKYPRIFVAQTYFSFHVTRDAKVDATRWCVIVMPAPLDLGSAEFYAEDESLAGIQNAYKEFLAAMLAYIGETEAEDRAAAIFSIEQARAARMAPPETYMNPNMLFYETTWEKMLDITSASQKFLIDAELFEILRHKNIYCFEIEYIKFAESLYTQENLQVLKDRAMLNLLWSFGTVLGDDFSELTDNLMAAMFGQIGERAGLEQRAQSFVTTMMSRTFSRLYAEKFSSQEIKDDVTEMVEDIRDALRVRIMGLEWMSDETKKAAVEKLDAVRTFIAFPDEPIESIPFELRAKDDGGCLVALMFSLAELNHALAIEMYKGPAEINLWEHIPTWTVNAFYSPTDNAIFIPAGILHEPFYSPGAPREQNLGAIGAVIAHEFTHAFDPSGAQYDKHGTLRNWWTAEDYEAFGELTARMVAALSDIVFIGDMRVNGLLTVGEAVTDLGAMASVLDIVREMPDGDLAMAMKSWAAVWAARISPEMVVFMLHTGVHPPNKVRTNFILSQLDDFYTVFNITEGDGMYIPREKRISIW